MADGIGKQVDDASRDGTGDVAIAAARLGIMPNRASASRSEGFEASGAVSSVWTGKRVMGTAFHCDD